MANKVKVAICSQDNEYKQRFMRCFLHHYKSRYELYLFGTLEEMCQDKTAIYDILLLEDSLRSEGEISVAAKTKVIVLYEGEKKDCIGESRILYEPKYQEVYKIQNAIQRVLQNLDCSTTSKKEAKIIGVFSLGCENLQIPFSALLAEECVEMGKTLVVNLQPYSGFEIEKNTAGFCLEDLMLSVVTGNLSKSRFEAAIGQEENWDFVYSVENAESLAEVTDQIYRQILDVFIQGMGYINIIINFGTAFLGVHSLMSSCDKFYFLTKQVEVIEKREKQFLNELVERGYEEFTKKIYRMELTETKNICREWRQITQQWRWSTVGDYMRMDLWGVHTNGEVV